MRGIRAQFVFPEVSLPQLPLTALGSEDHQFSTNPPLIKNMDVLAQIIMLFTRPTPKGGYPISGLSLYAKYTEKVRWSKSSRNMYLGMLSELFILSSLFEADWECVICPLA